ncbi:MAG: radical SAM protein [Limnochordaceae bacterium]|nr:radical SAM protein [Limnochordaceae bacterium]
MTTATPSSYPAYLALYESGELERRAGRAVAALASCRLCPRNCGADRLVDQRRTCRTGRLARVASAFAHHGEEACLRGRRGSGTIFFSWCNLRCVFCQNFDISQAGEGAELTAEELAALMLRLQAAGCHNINLVTPEHVVPQVLEALVIAVRGGLRLPLVYNTSAYDSMESLALLDGVVDIYMPDFKVWDPAVSRRLLKAPDYPEVARRTVKEMHRQVGPLVIDEHGLARRGVLLRHLVMPGGLAGTAEIMQWVARELSPDTYVNLMAQYYPAGRVLAEPRAFPELARRITRAEYEAALAAARAAGLWRFDRDG